MGHLGDDDLEAIDVHGEPIAAGVRGDLQS